MAHTRYPALAVSPAATQGIPILAPSLSLLVKWHLEYRMVKERTWDTVAALSPQHASVVPRHPDANETEPYDRECGV